MTPGISKARLVSNPETNPKETKVDEAGRRSRCDDSREGETGLKRLADGGPPLDERAETASWVYI